MCTRKHCNAAASRGSITKWLIKALFLLLFQVIVAQFRPPPHSPMTLRFAAQPTSIENKKHDVEA